MASYPPLYSYALLLDNQGNRFHPGLHCLPLDYRSRPELAQVYRVERVTGSALGSVNDEYTTGLELVALLLPEPRLPLTAEVARHMGIVSLSSYCGPDRYLPWYLAFRAAGILFWVTLDERPQADPRRAVLHAWWPAGPANARLFDFAVDFADAGYPHFDFELDCLRYFRQRLVRHGAAIADVELSAISQ